MTNPEFHFTRRCRQRGITKTDPHAVMSAIQVEWRKLKAGEAAEIEPVMPGKVKDGEPTHFYRFKVAEGYFYALMCEVNGFPLTVYSQREMRLAKESRKKRKRYACRARNDSARTVTGAR